MHVCTFCQHTGKRGALYLLAVKGHQTQRVHRPCGEKLLNELLAGIEARLEPSPELRAQWREERQKKEDAKRVHSFWAEKLEGLVLPSPQAPSRLPYLVSNMVLETNRGETVMQIVMIQGAVVGIASFTTGFVPRQCTTRRMSEDDVQATCLWFERHGQTEEAEKLLQRWCQGIPCYCRR